MKIIQREDGTYYLEFTKWGYTHWIDPFKTYNEAYDFYRRYYANQDDLK